MVTQAISLSPTQQVSSRKMQLKAEDFIKMMVTQLQHQDPMEPAKNEDLLAQMSQIGQLQASTDMQAMLKSLAAQNQIGSAGQMIGKMVAGLDDGDESVTGLVSSVRVVNEKVYLELDNGKTLRLERVTAIAPNKTTATEGPVSGRESLAA